MAKNARSKKRNSAAYTDLCDAIIDTVKDENLEPAFRAQVLTLPTVAEIARTIGRNVDPDAVYRERKSLQTMVGRAFGKEGMKQVRKLQKAANTAANEQLASGFRSLKNALLPLLTLARVEKAPEFARSMFKNAKNMTDRLAALNTILHCQNDGTLIEECLEAFYKRYKDNHLAMDKWFSAQATMSGKKGLARIKKLSTHDAFSLENPNRARALLGPMASANLTAFHQSNGAGYEFFADQILSLDARNPQIAARLLTLMNNWKMFDRSRVGKAKKALTRIAATPGLSKDVQEIVDRTLGS